VQRRLVDEHAGQDRVSAPQVDGGHFKDKNGTRTSADVRGKGKNWEVGQGQGTGFGD